MSKKENLDSTSLKDIPNLLTPLTTKTNASNFWIMRIVFFVVKTT